MTPERAARIAAFVPLGVVGVVSFSRAEQVAGYIAKFATKVTESFGAGLDRRLGADDLDHLDQLPAHVAELVRAAWALGSRPELEGLRLGQGWWWLGLVGRAR